MCVHACLYLLCRCGKTTKQYSHNMCCIGKSQLVSLDSSVAGLVHSACEFIPERERKFWRLQFKNSVYFSLDYSRTHARNSYTVCFGENQFGIIQYFLEVSDRMCNSTCVLAVVNVLSVESYHNLPHLYLCRTTSIFKAIHADTLNYKCVYVALCGTQFIGVFPSRIISLLS